MSLRGSSSKLIVTLLSVLGGCSAPAHSQNQAHFAQPGVQCSSLQQELIAFVGRLPERALIASGTEDLPQASVGETPGSGPLLRLNEDSASWDGGALPGKSAAERAERLAALPAVASAKTVYVAASPTLDVQTVRTYLVRLPSSAELRLLVRVPTPSVNGKLKDSDSNPSAAALLRERDPRTRESLAERGYAEYSRCAGVSALVSSLAGLAPAERWSKLREGLLAALPNCACSELDPSGLKPLILAEQRAGSAALGALPLGFLRDQRCGASMPLRSLGKLLAQIEQFNEEFSGKFQDDALTFEQVLTNDRLLGYFCNALPGETLAALARARATLYFRVPGSTSCQAWQFEPLAPGAPMGSLRQVRSGGPAGLVFHYWQGAEDIRVFGPAAENPASKATDTRSWACQSDERLTSVDAASLELEHGRWFFDEQSCSKATLDSVVAGCFAQFASGELRGNPAY